MSTNPYSIMKQLRLFDEVEKNRMEIIGYEIRHIVKLKTGIDFSHTSELIKQYIDKHRGMCSHHTVVFDWIDGPEVPEKYQSLSFFELRLVENCSGIASDMESSLCQACSWISDVKVETLDAGQIDIMIYPVDNEHVSDEQIQHCALLGELLASLPGICITVKVAKDEAMLVRGLDPLNSQARKTGIINKEIRNLFDSDEEFFREVVKKNYLIDLRSTIPLLNFNGSSILLPNNYKITNLKFLLPFYERIYLPVPFGDSEPENFFGASRKEILALIESGRIIPIIQQNYARYSEKTLKQVMEFDRFISPRQLTVALATDFLARNPLWIIAQKDLNLAKKILLNTNNAISSYHGKEDKVIEFTKNWIDYQVDAITEFDSMMLNKGTLSALYLGPGALLTKLFPSKSKNQQMPDIEAWLGGMEIMHASALRSVCLPSMGGAIKLYEILASLYSYRRVNSLEQLSTANELDKILEDIEITCPQDISVVEWAKVVDTEDVKQIRRILTKACSDCSLNDSAGLRKSAQRLAELTEQYTKRRDFDKKLIERLDLIGIFIEAIVSQKEWPSPMGWLIGVAVKNSAPILWDKISHYGLLSEAQDILRSVGTLTNVNAVRLHRVRSKINSNIVDGVKTNYR